MLKKSFAVIPSGESDILSYQLKKIETDSSSPGAPRIDKNRVFSVLR